jgi:hypothetical protein
MARHGFPRVPRQIIEPLLRAWRQEWPEAAQHIHWQRLPDELTPRQVVDQAGLSAFRAWLAAPPTLPAVVQRVILLHVVSLSYEAGFITDPDECTRLCQPQA